MKAAAGRLDVIATPIGNLGDLSPRAREVLARADLIAAEDTRHTAQLLAAVGVSRPLCSLHQHNEAKRVPELLQRLQSGECIALVSDAGTPLLSDPGFLLVRAAAAAGVEVRAVPGPSAITAALSIAGIATDRFVFEGFLPAKAGERRQRLQSLVHEPRTMVFFEAPHRIADCLADLAANFGSERPAVLARELSKAFESAYRGSLAELAARATRDGDMARGEIVLVVEGAPMAAGTGDAELMQRALTLLCPELPLARAAGIAARLSGMPREVAYAAARALGGRS